MNEIVDKFLLAGHEFMPEMHLKQPGFTYSACGLFTKIKKELKNLKKQEILAIFTKMNLDKACFQHDMAYGDFKDLKRTIADKVLRDKAFKSASDQKYDGYQRGLASMVYKFFDKKPEGSRIANNNKNMQLADELHKPIIRKFKKRKVYSSFKDNIWGVDLADMQLLSKFNKEFRFLLCVIDIISKYAWVIPLKNKEGVSTVNAFQKTFKKNLIESLIKYGQTKEVNFIIILLKNGNKI